MTFRGLQGPYRVASIPREEALMDQRLVASLATHHQKKAPQAMKSELAITIT
ncbi:hypothetical protein [Corallococcus sp. M7]